MFAVVTLRDGRKLRLDVVDVAVTDSNGSTVSAAFTAPQGIIRAANCNDPDWLAFCREASVDPGPPLATLR